MGQYHKLVSIDAKEHLNPHDLGSGLKAWEILANDTIPAALVGLISVNPGNGAADLANSPMTGRWSGNRILAVGDYAEDGDIPNWSGPPLSRLYRLCVDDSDLVEPTLESVMNDYADCIINGHRPQSAGWLSEIKRTLDECLKAHRESTAEITKFGAFRRISPIGMLEQGMSVRIVGDGWKNVVRVRALAQRQPDGTPEFELIERDGGCAGGYLAYLERCGITKEMWNRPPRDGSWCGVSDVRVDEGQTRVLTSLDRGEFIDPARFGEVPTTAGIMQGEWGSAAAMTALLFHPQRRGGGDLYSGHPRIGSWANTRLIASSEYEGELPSTEQIKGGFEDITEDVMALISKERDS